MLDRFLDIINDIPIGTLIFLGALVWSFFGRKSKQQTQEAGPRPARVPAEPSNYSSDDRRAREERNEWGHAQFDTPDSRYANDDWGHADFRTPDNRYGDANEWGQTKYGFESTDWGSTFDDDNRDDEPRIVGRG